MNRTACLHAGRAVLVFATACHLQGKDTTPPTPDYEVPSIVTTSVDCDGDDAEWTIEATTTAWTGNGLVLLTKDGAYVERHSFESVSAAGDGSADELRVRLDVVADWRTVEAGQTTVFNCGEAGVTGQIRVYVRTGGDIADCRRFGEEPARWDTWEPDVVCPDEPVTGT